MNSMRLFDVPYHQQKNYQKDTMFVTKKEGIWTPMDTTTFIEKALLVSRGLIAFGISAGDKIAVASTNRVEWNILDIAVQQVGAILVPLYPNISVNDYRFILNDSSTKICVVGNKELWDKISSIRKDVPSLEHLFVFDEIEGCSNWSEISEKAEKTDPSEVKSRMDLVKSGDLVTIIYTSGTTGNPKGVMLSHSNILSNVFACQSRIPADNNSKVLSFLPVCHIYERMLHYLYMYIGCSIYFGESMETIGENIREVKPDVFSAVPRLIEKVYDKIIAKGDELSGLKKKLFFWAVALAENYELKGKSPLYKIQLALARKLIFSKWKLALGGNVKAIASGSAALQPRLARIFLAAGIPILEGYGLSETSPVVTVNSFDKGICFGSVGTLIEHVEVKIAEDGEILVKGPNVMLGYYNNEEATNEVMDKDGWFHTGDIGVFIDEKFLKITDRKKEIFKTSGGKYIAPQAMENKFKESRFIEQLIVVGVGEKFPGAFIVPSFLFLKEWALQNNLNFDKLSNEELVLNEKVLLKFKEEIDEINEFFGSWEQLKKFVLLPKEFSIDGGELTPTLKLNRKKIMEKYQKEYALLYGN
ncbi:MAG: long-chain fatty acid--CoA ligase [Crocinitomicaceae bacterium]|nr:long-chain fatty acid--CoA ligase [Crocinitomicaceae bacterium]